MSEPKIVVEDKNVFIHFSGMKIPVLQSQRFKIGGSDDLLLKAAGKKNLKLENPQLLDLTVGLARDAFHLAALGFNVVGLERNDFIYSALAEARKQAGEQKETAKTTGRISFVHADALSYLKNLKEKVDVVLYDPMFPEKKKAAAVGKESQLLQALAVSDDAENEAELAQLALSMAVDRLVVKRPLPAPEVLPKPSMSFKGKAVRYDVYLAKRP
ncbi:MAG: class I SAM-dependent methyltransferase [Bdellovibrionota bacterium]